MEHVTGSVPDKVAIVGCGPSMQDYVNIMASHQSVGFSVDEVWAINGAGSVIRSDVTFILDDAHFMKASGSDLYEKVPQPRITSAPRIEGDVAYPLAEILAIPGARDFLNHTAAYAVAYAIALGVKEIDVFGCDYIASEYHHQGRGADKATRYMACISFWLGVAAARGINVVVTPNSPLLGADASASENFYGYIVPPIVKREGD